jgi:hypothetical protein
MVVMKEGVKLSSLNRSRQHDLPTPESQIRRSLICEEAGCVRREDVLVKWVVEGGGGGVRESHSCGFGLPWRGQSVEESDSGWREKEHKRQWKEQSEGRGDGSGISADGEFTGQSEVMRLVAEGRCMCLCLLSWARVTGCVCEVDNQQREGNDVGGGAFVLFCGS